VREAAKGVPRAPAAEREGARPIPSAGPFLQCRRPVAVPRQGRRGRAAAYRNIALIEPQVASSTGESQGPQY